MRSQRGQATIDYIAVVLVVALVLGAAAAVAVATGLGEKVVAAMRQALCVVSGEACMPPPPSTCVRASSRHEEGLVVDIAFLRVGRRAVEMRETYADGSVGVTIVDHAEGGAVVRNGLEAHVRWGGSSWAYGTEQRYAMLAARSTGRTWLRPDAIAADRVSRQVALERLSTYPANTIPGYDSRPPMHAEARAPPADITFTERSVGAQGALQLGGSASIALAGRRAYGERTDHRTRDRTVYVSNDEAAAGSIVIGRGEAAAALGGEERYAITFDAAGRPRDLMVLSALDVAGSAKLPRHLAALAGRLHVPLDGARHIETEQHLDLTVPANARIAAAFLGASPGGDDVMRTANLLRDKLDAEGSETVRTYRSDGSGHEVGAHAALGGVAVGARIGSDDQYSTLDRALARDPGGAWGPDRACLPAASRALGAA